ncbi:MAG: histidine kinase N-terminal 7TM domain-containing protein [Enterocloster sp.]
MHSSRETRRLNIICVCLIVSAGFFRLAGFRRFSYNTIIFTLFTAAAFIWGFQLRRRLLQPAVKRNLTGVVVLILFWIAVRTIKYDFAAEGHIIKRYIWYLYYIPMVLIPLLMFLSVLWIGRSEDRPISGLWNLLYLPAAVLIAGMLTNDLHGAAFLFPDGPALWDEENFIRGPLYYLEISWMTVMFLAMLGVVFFRCAVPASRRKIWIPALPIGIGAVYVLCIINQWNMFGIFLNQPEMGSFLFAAFMETLICAHLFPANDRYGEFFHASSIGAGIMDRDGVIRFESARSLPVTRSQIEQAQTEMLLLEDGNAALRSHAIHGGVGYWMRDIAEISRINRELEELGDVTAEENSMLKAETRLEIERVRVEEQNKLYDDMAKGVGKQLDILNRILENPPQEEPAFEKSMKYACILNAYIKRHSNLLLLCHQSSMIHSEELRRAVWESLEYIRMYGIRAQGYLDGKQNLSCRTALLAYELFEEVLEAAVPGADNLLVYGMAAEESLTLRMEVHAPGKHLENEEWEKRTAAFGGTLETEIDEDTEYVTLVLPAGGEKI